MRHAQARGMRLHVRAFSRAITEGDPIKKIKLVDGKTGKTELTLKPDKPPKDERLNIPQKTLADWNECLHRVLKLNPMEGEDFIHL